MTKSFKFIGTFLDTTKNLVTLILFVFVISTNVHCQKKITDSLNQIKITYENRPGFVPSDTNYINLLYKLGRSYIYQIPDSTKTISERIIQLSKAADYEKGIAGGELNLGIYLNINGKFDEGFAYLESAEKRASESNAKKMLLKCINAKAMGQFMKGDYPSAYVECKKGERLAADLGDLEMQVFFSMNLGTCFAILRDYEQALPYFKDALKIVEMSGDMIQKAQIESNLGYLYLHTNDFEKAKKHCTNAIKVLNKSQFQAWESFAWATLGEVANRENDHSSAIDYFSKSDSLLASIEDMQRKAETAQGFAETYYFMNDMEKSIEYALSAEKISQNIKYHNGVVKASELLYKLLVKKDEPKKALQYLSNAKRLSDSILESENRTKFLLLETQAQFNREKRIAEFDNEKKLAKQKTITYVAVILIVALIIITFLVRKNALNEKKISLRLKELNATKDKLFSIIGHELKNPIKTLQELLKLYGSREISEEDVAKLAPRLKQNVDHSAFTLNNLLYWAKTQMNGITPDTTTILVKSKVNAICQTFDAKIKAKNLQIKCNVAPNLTLMMDATHFEIVIRNLISNAIKYSHKNGIIQFASRESVEGKVMLRICDKGVGIEQSLIEKILGNESILSSPGTFDEKGTGIGLKITKELIKINGGALKINNGNDEGTCVTIYFKQR